MINIARLRYRWSPTHADCLVIDDLRVDAGEALFVAGASGSGKSTLLGLLAGVLLPSKGSVSLNGTAWSSLSSARRDAYRADHVGYIFQQFNLLPYLSVLDNVVLPCRFSMVRSARATRGGTSPTGSAQELLSRVGLDERLWGRQAASLSVGQQQRVAAARALIGRPELVVADEPTSALDAALRDSFVDLLLAKCRDANSTLIFVSHDEHLRQRFDRHLRLADLNRITTTEPRARMIG